MEMMGGLDSFGVYAYPEGYEKPPHTTALGDKKLINGLWYYDDGYNVNPEEYDKQITGPEMTAALEQEMDSVENGETKRTEVVDDSRKMLHTVLNKLQTHKTKIAEKLHKALLADQVLGKCPKCGEDLIIIRMPKGTRFVGCKGYRTKGCSESFPLPARGQITNLHKDCPDCGLPMIRIHYYGRRPFDMCVNHKCPSKKDWNHKNRKTKEAAKNGSTNQPQEKRAR